MGLDIFRHILPPWLTGGRDAGIGASADRRLFLVPTWVRDLAADQVFWGVFLVWAGCWLSWSVCLARFSSSLPFLDEYIFVQTGVATRESPITYSWVWEPANEHRMPLLRLWVVLLGRIFHWDSRPMLQVDLALVALGALALVLAARAVRGRSDLCDSFLPLLVLSSAHHETLLLYVYAYAMPGAVWCLTASAVMVGWPHRSVRHLLLYLVGALVVAWAGGPAGNLWALGLCAPLLRGCWERKSLGWKLTAGTGAATVAGSSAFLIYNVPPSPAVHLAFRSDSWLMTLRAAAKFSVGWMGGPILQVVWPWAILVLVVPGLYLFVRFLADVRRLRFAGMARWWDLSALLLSALAVTVAMGYGRAKYTGLWPSRYCVLEAPIAVALYLMLVRCGAPKALMTCLAIGMAVCVGWNWPTDLDRANSTHPQQVQLVDGLRRGREPLSVLMERYHDAIGFRMESGPQQLVGWWLHMRQAGISTFHKVHGTNADPSRRCLLWQPESGRLTDSLRAIDDPGALGGRAVRAEADGSGAVAVYEVAVPASGQYQLCCRWMTPASGQAFGVAVDDGAVMRQPAPCGPNYSPCLLGPSLLLEAGKHRLTIVWPGAGSRLDVLELTPQ